MSIGVPEAIGARVRAVASVVVAISVTEAVSLTVPAILCRCASGKSNTHRNRKNHLLHFSISNLSGAVRGNAFLLDVTSIGIGGLY